jgi:hypothetical protein
MRIYLTKEFEDAFGGTEEPEEELDECDDEGDTSDLVNALLDIVLALIDEDRCYDEEVIGTDDDEDYYIMTVEQADKYREKEDGRVYVATISKK